MTISSEDKNKIENIVQPFVNQVISKATNADIAIHALNAITDNKCYKEHSSDFEKSGISNLLEEMRSIYNSANPTVLLEAVWLK